MAVPEKAPGPHEVAEAHVETSWVCPFCKADQSVWGDGAVGTWMECDKCGKEAFLL